MDIAQLELNRLNNDKLIEFPRNKHVHFPFKINGADLNRVVISLKKKKKSDLIKIMTLFPRKKQLIPQSTILGHDFQWNRKLDNFIIKGNFINS